MEWYEIIEIDQIDSPGLFIYKDRVVKNLKEMIRLADRPERLMPHVKTHKMEEMVKLHLSLGIHNFKCDTIAEAEMVAVVGGKNILIALQPVGPKYQRIINLVKKFPFSFFSVIIDHEESLHQLNRYFIESGLRIGVYLDVNVGMNRTGIGIDQNAKKLIELCLSLSGVTFMGIHAYDGHNTLTDFKAREERCRTEFEPVYKLKDWAEKRSNHKLAVIAGGTPTFPIHASQNKAVCSPGTTVLWDLASSERFPDLDFNFSAVLITRVISVINQNLICLDLGHKAIAAEMPLPRVKFINHQEAIPISQSEEHLVVKVPDNQSYRIGDVFYGIPWHICPTCALYQDVAVVENNHWIDTWKVNARNRKISV
jgi:D-serine deaminase-like pyridoxal phosphate-dependent protein